MWLAHSSQAISYLHYSHVGGGGGQKDSASHATGRGNRGTPSRIPISSDRGVCFFFVSHPSVRGYCRAINRIAHALPTTNNFDYDTN